MDPIAVLHRIAPELMETIGQRYAILQMISFMAPVGRRILSTQLAQSERTIRREVEFLQEQGFIVGSHSGMRLTESGQKILFDLKDYIREIRGLADLETEIKNILQVNTVIVVPGDADLDPMVKKDMAKATTRYLRSILKDGDVLAVTGGSTLAKVADSLSSDGVSRDVVVVPARGGLGEDVNLQANSIAAKLAQGLGGSYRLLHAPDNVIPGLLETITNEPHIRDVIALGRRAQVLLHGIGTAEEMAKRRGLDEELVMQLIADGAVGEAFGYYFDQNGKIVYTTSSVGLRLEDLAKIPVIVAVGGGKSKAWAVWSVVKLGKCDVCITDEGVARRLINIIKNKEENSNGN